MNTKFVGDIIDEKLEKNDEIVVFSFYELRIKYNLTEEEIEKFLTLSKNRFENSKYKVYFTGEKYEYENEIKTVKENELMVAIKINRPNENKKKTKKDKTKNKK